MQCVVTLAYIIFLLTVCDDLNGQSVKDTVHKMTLNDCIDYALENNATHKQALIDEEVAFRNYRIGLTGWFPQIRADYSLTHYFQLPVSLFPVDFNNPSGARRAVRLGLPNQSSLSVTAQQVIMSNDLVLAAKLGKYSRIQASENTTNNEITIVINVSKAFYDVLITEQQLSVTKQDIARQQKLLNDAYSMYQSGVTDKTDYKRAVIALNNSQSNYRRTLESYHYKNTYLKQQMGYPSNKSLSLLFDSSAMKSEALLDTNQAPDYKKRIEYQLMQSQRQLQEVNRKYYKYGFIPTIVGFVNYNILYLNKTLSQLYSTQYPYSAIGLVASVPIFQGHRRVHNLQKATLLVKRVELDQEYFKEVVETQYVQALGNYKSNLNELTLQEENLKIAQEVFEVVKLQYQEGIKTFLDVIISESDLRHAEVNYLNALYNLLSSKLDVQKALGVIR